MFGLVQFLLHALRSHIDYRYGQSGTCKGLGNPHLMSQLLEFELSLSQNQDGIKAYHKFDIEPPSIFQKST